MNSIWLKSALMLDIKLMIRECVKKWDWCVSFVRSMKQRWQHWKRDWNSLRMGHRQWVPLLWSSSHTSNVLYQKLSHQYLNRCGQMLILHEPNVNANLSAHHCPTLPFFTLWSRSSLLQQIKHYEALSKRYSSNWWITMSLFWCMYDKLCESGWLQGVPNSEVDKLVLT